MIFFLVIGILLSIYFLWKIFVKGAEKKIILSNPKFYVFDFWTHLIYIVNINSQDREWNGTENDERDFMTRLLRLDAHPCYSMAKLSLGKQFEDLGWGVYYSIILSAFSNVYQDEIWNVFMNNSQYDVNDMFDRIYVRLCIHTLKYYEIENIDELFELD